jgi:hypothetical protein
MSKIFQKNPGIYIVCLILLILNLIAGVYTAHGARTLNISDGDEWHYFKGTVEPPNKWNHIGFDDSAWQTGPSGFGYGVGKHNTLLSDMRGKYKSVYIRREFTVVNYHRISRLILSVVCDGPFVAYLDGIEAIRSNRRQLGDPLDLSGFAHELDHRINVLAIKCSNDDIDSDDFSFIPSFQLHEE